MSSQPPPATNAPSAIPTMLKNILLVSLGLSAGLLIPKCDLLLGNGRPPEKTVKDTITKSGRGKGAYPQRVKVLSFGSTVRSTGQFGPEGTTVYPVRVDNGGDLDDLYLWRDAFGIWQWDDAPR